MTGPGTLRPWSASPQRAAHCRTPWRNPLGRRTLAPPTLWFALRRFASPRSLPRTESPPEPHHFHNGSAFCTVPRARPWNGGPPQRSPAAPRASSSDSGARHGRQAATNPERIHSRRRAALRTQLRLWRPAASRSHDMTSKPSRARAPPHGAVRTLPQSTAAASARIYWLPPATHELPERVGAEHGEVQERRWKPVKHLRHVGAFLVSSCAGPRTTPSEPRCHEILAAT